MNWFPSVDPSLCGRLCLTLLHSMWQLSVLALAARLIVLSLRKRSVEFEYVIHLAALVVAMLALPITFSMVNAPIGNSLVTSNTRSDAMVASPMEIGDVRKVPSFDSQAVVDKVPGSNRLETEKLPLVRSLADLWANRMTLAPWLAGLYGLGVVIMLTRLGAAIVWTERLRSQAIPITSGSLFDSLNALSKQWSMRVVPVLAKTESIVLPKLIGLVRPVILLPASALAGLSASDLEMILIHELAHVRRYDLWGNLFQRMVEVVLFFNPAAWYLSRRISMLREFCCDEMTCCTFTKSESEPRLQYAIALLRAIELALPQRMSNPEWTSLAFSGRSPSELRRRVASILGEPLNDPIRLSRGGMLIVAIVAGIAICGPLLSKPVAHAADQKTETKRDDKGADKLTQSFSFGSKVEVLALGTHDEKEQKWWHADGRPIAVPSFTWKPQGQVGMPNVVFRRIVFRIHDFPEAAHIQWRVVNAQGSAGAKIVVNDKEPEGYFAQYFGVPRILKAVDLKVGVANGEWKTVVSANGQFSNAFGSEGLSIVFSEVVQKENVTQIVVSHDCFDRDFRIVAVTKDEKIHDQVGYGGASAGKIYQSTARFPDLKRKDIDHFEFQVRDYEWIEIKDLPLEPTITVSMNPNAMTSFYVGMSR